MPVAITVFVMLLLAYVVWRFRETANPTPSRTSHNTPLEIAWTVVPVLIVYIIFQRQLQGSVSQSTIK